MRHRIQEFGEAEGTQLSLFVFLVFGLLLVVGAIGVAGNERVLSVIVLTVMISVVAHGVSAVPLSKLYGRSTTFEPG